MRFWNLERKLVGLPALFLLPVAAVTGVLLGLQRLRVLEARPWAFVVAVAVGGGALVLYLVVLVIVLRRSLIRAVHEIRLGAELIATIHPGHRLRLPIGGELESLAEEINRMADRLTEARSGLEREVAWATRELTVERGKLSAVLEALGEGVAVATGEGRVTLANRAAHGLLGAADGGLLGRSLFEFVDRNKVAHFLERLRAGGAGAERFSLQPVGGGVLATAMTPFFDDDRRMIGFVLVLHDVTRPARSDEERQRRLGDAVRELRGSVASVRSLSENLLGDPAGAGTSARRLLDALHDEALRLSGLVRELGQPARLGLAGPSWHFETVTVGELTAMTVRRLEQDGGAAGLEIDADLASLPSLRVEVSALSGALAHALRAVLARRDPAGRAWLRPSRRGRVVQFDAGVDGRASPTELEAFLDTPLPAGMGRATVREIVHRHAGEAWAYEGPGQVGIRVTLPGAEPGDTAADPAEQGPVAGVALVGAGTRSGSAGAGPRPQRTGLYDFSLFDEMVRHLPLADRALPLLDLEYVVFDVETTGLNPDDGDRVVSVAGVRVRRGAVKPGEIFDALVNPRRPIPAASARLHGITDAMVAEAPPIDVVLPAFLRFVGDAVLVGHQVWFDVRCLATEGARLGLPPITVAHPVLDTLVLSEVVHGGLADHGLETVAGRLGVGIRGRHSALGDALATAEIFVRLLELLKKRGTVTLGQALDASRVIEQARAGEITPGAGP